MELVTRVSRALPATSTTLGCHDDIVNVNKYGLGLSKYNRHDLVRDVECTVVAVVPIDFLAACLAIVPAMVLVIDNSQALCWYD